MDGLHVIPTPRDRAWPASGSFLAELLLAFDWDVIHLGADSALSIGVRLCLNAQPCRLALSGRRSNGTLRRSAGGFISCALGDGCSSVSLDSVAVVCDGPPGNASLLTADGTALSVSNSSIRNCSCGANGGAIQAFRGAAVSLSFSLLEDLQSGGYGGAVSLVGAQLSALGVTFRRCQAAQDGGAISAVDSECTFSAATASGLSVAASVFEQCRAQRRGGAIASGSGSSAVADSDFLACASGASGGAVFVSEQGLGVSLTLVRASLVRNRALGAGGGALHLQNVAASVVGMSAAGNEALSGGGGVVYWEGVRPRISCGPGTYALNASADYPCAYCGGGKYQSGVGATDPSGCAECGAGSFADQGASACELCGAGTFATQAGATARSACSSCEVGAYLTADGAPAASNCTACAAGTYSGTAGASGCESCPGGTYSSQAGATSAASCSGICAAGSYAGPGASACSLCGLGTYSTGNARAPARRRTGPPWRLHRAASLPDFCFPSRALGCRLSPLLLARLRGDVRGELRAVPGGGLLQRHGRHGVLPVRRRVVLAQRLQRLPAVPPGLVLGQPVVVVPHVPGRQVLVGGGGDGVRGLRGGRGAAGRGGRDAPDLHEHRQQQHLLLQQLVLRLDVHGGDHRPVH